MTDNYHADPCPSPSLSCSVAKLLLNRSPRHAWMAHPRLNPAYEPLEAARLDYGSAAHAGLLEGEGAWVIVDADDWRTKAAKEERDEARADGLIPLLAHQAVTVRKMVSVASKAWNACPDMDGYPMKAGEVEKAILWQDGKTGIWCRSKLDWLASDRRLIIDYKTTEGSASPSDADKLVSRMSYDLQVAAYEDAVQSLPEIVERPRFIFMIQETDPPFACSFVGLEPAWLEVAREKWARAKALWSECLRSGRWPAYSNRVHWLEPPPWMVASWQTEEYRRDSESPVNTFAGDARFLGA